MESSKKILGKITPFGERIIKVLKDNNLVKPNGEVNYSEAERLCDIKGSNLSKAVKANTMHGENLRKFLGKFHVERDWLLHGRGQMQSEEKKKNGTDGDKSDDNNGKDLEPILQELIERNEKYRLVPTIILDKYEILSNRELESREKLLQKMLDQAEEISATKQVVLDEKNKYIESLEEEVAELRNKLKQIPPSQDAQ